MPARLRDVDSGERMLLWRGLLPTVLAVGTIAGALAFYLRMTRQFSLLACLAVVLAGVGVGVVLGLAIAWATGHASRGLTRVLLGAGNLAPAPSFSEQDAMVARGRYQAAIDSYAAHLARHPSDHDARFAMAEIYAGPLADPDSASRVLAEIRAAGATPNQEYRVSQTLIDLYQASGNRGRLMVELARFADRHRGTPAADSARRALLELKGDADSA